VNEHTNKFEKKIDYAHDMYQDIYVLQVEISLNMIISRLVHFILIAFHAHNLTS